MRRSLLIFDMLFMLLCLSVSGVAQDKKVMKAAAKEAKATAKVLQKEGWKLFGSGTLQSALEAHLAKIKSKEYVEYRGKVVNYADVSDAIAYARAEAISDYATSINSRFESVLSRDSKGVPEAGIQAIKRSFTLSMDASISGQLEPSYVIYLKPKGERLYQVEAYYLIERNADHQAKISALHRACQLAKVEKDLEKELQAELEEEPNDGAEDSL